MFYNIAHKARQHTYSAKKRHRPHMAAGGTPLLFLSKQESLLLAPVQRDGLAEGGAGYGCGAVAGHDSMHNRRRETREPYDPRHERAVQPERTGQFQGVGVRPLVDRLLPRMGARQKRQKGRVRAFVGRHDHLLAAVASKHGGYVDADVAVRGDFDFRFHKPP